MATAIPWIMTALSAAGTAASIKGARGGATNVLAPAAPTIDTATQSIQDVNRLRRRRGVLSTLFGGSNSTPVTATKQLLGS
jgi:hypothetical protein